MMPAEAPRYPAHNGGGDVFAGGLVFLLEAIHAAEPDRGILGVAGVLIVAGAAQ